MDLTQRVMMKVVGTVCLMFIAQDYITLNASPDRNAWSRGNRWFIREVIEATASYNDYTAEIDDKSRA